MRVLQETIDQLKPDDFDGESEDDQEDLDIYSSTVSHAMRRCRTAFHSNHVSLFCSELGSHMLIKLLHVYRHRSPHVHGYALIDGKHQRIHINRELYVCCHAYLELM